MPTGQVKWFDPKKGYGFIIGIEGQDVFVHYSAILGDGFRYLKDGETVDYELVQGDKGDQAKNVVRPEPPADSDVPDAPAVSDVADVPDVPAEPDAPDVPDAAQPSA